MKQVKYLFHALTPCSLSDWRYKEFLQDHSPDSLIQYKYDHQGKRIRKWGIYGCDEQSGCLQQSITTLKTFYHGDYFETYGDDLISYKHISDGKDVITTVVDISDNLCDSCDPSNYYYTQNHIGSTVQLANDQGNVVEHMIYDPFGRTAYHWKSDETGQNGFAPGILFTGQKFDGDTGLYYFKARYYDPTIGVFTRPDPSLDGLNHYVYANANPIKYVDPSGMVADRSYVTPELAAYFMLIDLQKTQETENNKAAKKGENPREYGTLEYMVEDQYGEYFSYSIVVKGSEGSISAGYVKREAEKGAFAANDTAKSYNFSLGDGNKGMEASVLKTDSFTPLIFSHNHPNGSPEYSGGPYQHKGDWIEAYKNEVGLFIIGQKPLSSNFAIKFYNDDWNKYLKGRKFDSDKVIRWIKKNENPEF